MQYTIFGESHGPAIGVTITDLPAGLPIDETMLRRELSRRATGKNALSTARKETDEVRFLSGVYEGKTTGTPLCAVIENGDQHSADYAAIADKARPGHADYTAFLRYDGYSDMRGGGHFSGRLTAPLVVAGVLAKQILAQKNIFVGAHIASIHGVVDTPFEENRPDRASLALLAEKEFPVLSDTAGEKMKKEILFAREAGDSVGGVIECAALGVPAGFGAPDIDRNAEGALARQMFAVPAVKGIAFGAGFALAEMRGSEANDEFYMDGDSVHTRTNHNGGINGGITNGMPLLFSVVIKPTPSIALAQKTVNFRSRENAQIEVHGRHDPCIVHRAVPVIEAAAALAICELLRL